MRAFRAFLVGAVLGALAFVVPSCQCGSSSNNDAGCPTCGADSGSNGQDAGGGQDAGTDAGPADAGRDGGGFCVGPGFICGTFDTCCGLPCDPSSGLCPEADGGGGVGDGGCYLMGHLCAQSALCCSGVCDMNFGRCGIDAGTFDAGTCHVAGDSCGFLNALCCSNTCDAGICVENDAGCFDAGHLCAYGPQCCSGSCVATGLFPLCQ